MYLLCEGMCMNDWEFVALPWKAALLNLAT